jgi:hypothetical protein
MESTLATQRKPKLRQDVNVVIGVNAVEFSHRGRRCSFEFEAHEASAVSSLMLGLKSGERSMSDLMAGSPEIAEKIPRLLVDFDHLRLLIESEPQRSDIAQSGTQLYREVRRVADRTFARVAKSAFHAALTGGCATREQLIGYALEYYWIVQAAPGVIGPALGSARSPKERAVLQSFLKSELGHERFLLSALGAVGVRGVEQHLPLPATFALGASLGVYARQHLLSFKACLFLFERAQPEFVEAFEQRCRDLELPEGFYAPMRAHANLNNEYDHEDISRALMAFDGAVDAETCTVVKRHVAILAETVVEQEHQILAYYGVPGARYPRGR